MRQAHLPFNPMAALTAQHIGDPDHWLNGPEQRLDHSLAAAGTNDVQHRQGPTNTHSHHVFPVTRAEVSSEQTTGLAVTVSRIAVAATSSGSRARRSMLLIAPSLIVSANISPISAASRSNPIAWA